MHRALWLLSCPAVDGKPAPPVTCHAMRVAYWKACLDVRVLGVRPSRCGGDSDDTWR